MRQGHAFALAIGLALALAPMAAANGGARAQRPWNLTAASQFRLPAPAPLRSPATVTELRQIERLQATEHAASARTRQTLRATLATPAIVSWSRLALTMIAKYRPRPPVAARALAVVETAMADAQLAAADSRAAYPHARPAPARVDRRIAGLVPALRGSAFAPEDVAVGAAAAPVLEYLFPSEPQATFTRSADRVAQAELLAGRAYPGDVSGVRTLGANVAQAAIARAQTDGHSETAPAHPLQTGEAFWSPTPPLFEPPIGGPVGGWRPWVLAAPGAERGVLPGPSPYGSKAFMAQVAKVLAVRAHETSNQRSLAYFWNDGPGTLTPPGHWLEIAFGLVATAHLDDARAGVVLSSLAAAEADAAIAVFEAKYYWSSIRPITAIWRLCRGGRTLCGEASLAAGTEHGTYRGRWYPLIPTPPFPSYPSAHATFSGAAARVLGRFFPRARDSLTALAVQAANSRLYAGIHFDEDNKAGLALGRAVAGVELR